MAWLVLTVAGLFEVAWAISMKYSNGFTRLWPSVATVAFMTVSIVGLAYAMRTLPVGAAYAIWTGIGAAGTALLGMALFHEPRDAARIACLALIVAGIVGLKVLSPAGR